jgi:tRNA-uridine 2-sulfurtransferase
MKSQERKFANTQRNITKRKKVFVGLSGGVDSAVSLALLKKQGYDATGVFIKAWTPVPEQSSVSGSAPKYPCTWKEDRRSAMRACAVLNTPFMTLDLEKEYKKQVVDYMITEYKKGKTPNPDVMCNKKIKFGEFLKFALKNGADFVATGHYACIFPSPANRRGGKGGEILEESIDKEKDQSYFLWTLNQEQLKNILFPIGHLQKKEVRRLAERFGLPQATRKDSQGLCFLGEIDMKKFLQEHLKTKKGKVLNEKGEVVGEHDGAILYTLGERHGFRVKNNMTESLPLYVIAKNLKNNTITVAPKTNALPRGKGARKKFLIQDINWISKETNKKELTCRYRYRQEKIKCEIKKDLVIFREPQLIASGQSIVFYDGETCLGGAVIS